MTALPDPDAAAPLLALTREKLAAARARFAAAADPPARAQGLLATGRHDEAAELVPALAAGGLAERILAARILFAVQDLDELAPLVGELAGEDEARALLYRWWFLRDDLERVEREVEARREAGAATVTDRLAAARLAVQLLDLAAARAAYEAILAAGATDAERGRALHGLATVLYRDHDFDAALGRLRQALAARPLDADLLVTLANTLIRLGRTDEAIRAAELAVVLAPWHEAAHYLLGNGYAAKSYSRLAEDHPDAFTPGDDRAALAAAALAARRDVAAGRAGYADLARAHPGRADVAVHQGSLELLAERPAAARGFFHRALALCPGYGRAHNGLAKALEAERLAIAVHRPFYEKRFAAAAEPEVEGIERLVVNCSELGPRHRKRLALSLAPWGRYVSVLAEAGATYYVKPLYERLSEAPELHMLRDRRIGYDARLWDDVRGCGGFHTVTGVEDVERTVTGGYDTVVHELTHQVHDVLPAAAKRRIQELYRRTKERGADAFLSRYAGESVWEYFAEGANALATPRRDRFDSREIVRERLREMDPELLALVRELMEEADLAPCFALAFARRGDQHLRHGRAGEAVAVLREALGLAPGEESVTSRLAFALTVDGDAELGCRVASEGAAADPESAVLAIAHAEGLWLAGHGLAKAVAALEEARGRVRAEERFRVEERLGTLCWTAGDAARSREAFAAVLSYQADHPQGIWGLAAALALEKRWDAAFERYAEAVRRRSGAVRLRADFARDLLRAGELERAGEEIDAALLLDAADPEALALSARHLLSAGRLEEARERARRALEAGPWCDLARLARAEAELASGHGGEAREVLAPLVDRLERDAPPEYAYRPESGTYELAHDLPAVLREWIPARREVG